ncbi:MAG: hypothetical protein AB7E47_02685 [Desulfovibrionaceae bacterium]
MRRAVGAALLALGVMGLALAGGCAEPRYASAPYLADLDARFADAAWDGVHLPEGQQCARFGGHGATPPLVVGNIPIEANAIILEFGDRNGDDPANGGWGVIGFRVPVGVREAVIPALPGGVSALPEGFFLPRALGAAASVDKAYLPPCSGGQGHRYVVTIRAVAVPDKGGPIELLGMERLALGTY